MVTSKTLLVNFIQHTKVLIPHHVKLIITNDVACQCVYCPGLVGRGREKGRRRVLTCADRSPQHGGGGARGGGQYTVQPA